MLSLLLIPVNTKCWETPVAPLKEVKFAVNWHFYLTDFL